MNKKSYTAQEIAEIVSGEIIGDPSRTVNGVASIKDASAEQVSFIGNRKYRSQLDTARAGVILICQDLAKEELRDRTFIVCGNVDFAFSSVIALFAPPAPVYAPGVHPSAVVADDAILGAGVHVGANAVIASRAVIGDGTVIGAGCYVGEDVKIGSKTMLNPNVTVLHRCEIGHGTIIHSGVVIGADGFGFVPGPKGLVKVPQTGIVRIGSDVEIGANTTIDRARFGVTWIKDNVKIDDQVMVAHNVVVGESSILVAQCGIAGSAEIGRGVIIAAKAGINGHITIGDGCQIAGTSGVVKSLEAGSIAVGTPAESQREFMARVALPRKVEKLTAKLEALEKELAELKGK